MSVSVVSGVEKRLRRGGDSLRANRKGNRKNGKVDGLKGVKTVGKKAGKVQAPPRSLVFFLGNKPFLKPPYHFKSVGLPNVFLLNGITLEDHPEHGRLVSVEKLEGLLRAIGLRILENVQFSGSEFRFLRRQMKLTQVELGRKLGVSEQTVANYEKEVTTPPAASSSLRFHYLLHVLPPGTPTQVVSRALEGADELGVKLPEFRKRKIVNKWQEQDDLAA